MTTGGWWTALALLVGCGTLTSSPVPHMQQAPRVLFHETFSHPEQVQARWLLAAPAGTGWGMTTEGAAIRLTAAGNDVSLRRRFEITALRGARLRISARVRADAPTATAALTLRQSGPVPRHSDLVTARATGPESWRTLQAVADVDPASLDAEIALAVQGQGSAWFDDLTVEVLGSSPPAVAVALSRAQIENLAVLARAVMLIRYRHPSDQVAELDWNAFLPEAVGRVLQVSGSGSLLAALRELFAPIAPAIEFGTQRTEGSVVPPRGAGSHLARWRRLGLGSENPYAGWREGRDPDRAELELTLPVALPDLARCHRARLIAVGTSTGRDPASVFVSLDRAGAADQRMEAALTSDLREVRVETDVPGDTYRARLGVKVTGQASLELRSMSLVCDDTVAARLDLQLQRATWQQEGWDDLYTVRTTTCDSRDCLRVRRAPFDTSFVPSRDVLDVELDHGIWMHMPLAVWSDGARTYPAPEAVRRDARLAMTDLETRLATILGAWGIVDLFYPYLADQQIDWAGALPQALSEAAAASSAVQLHHALARLVAKLPDNHASAVHPALPINGIWPVALRRFGGELVVTGAVGEYAASFPVGAQIVSIDGTPAIQAYDDMRARVSAATPSWADIFIPFWLALGPQGTLSTLRVRTASGHERDVLVPHLPRSSHGLLVRDARPATGAQLSAGIYYIDLQGLTAERWQAVVPSVLRARAILLDARGVPSSAALTVLGHLIDRPIDSPTWQVPVLGSGTYQSSHWEVCPASPRLHAHVVMLTDGRVTSVGETILQMVRDHHLATLVGEPSGGTNGNIAEAILPAGFVLHFTGMRVPLADGTAIQGRGITPDRVVHPTLEGVRAGRDEVLAAAIELAGKL